MSQRRTSTLLALLLAASVHAAPRASIDATFRGTEQPLKIELLVRAGESDWKTVTRRALDTSARRVRFDALEPGIYQLRIEGSQPTEQLATKVILGKSDQRKIVITVEPVELAGRVTYGGTEIGGVLLVKHQEFHWRAGVAVAEDGTFRAPLWQRGEYTYEVRGPALTTPFHDHIDLTGASAVAIDIPDGRIQGVVRQASDHSPVVRAAVIVEGKAMSRTFSNAEGRFDFTGVKEGRYTVSVVSPMHLDSQPIVVQIDDEHRMRELTIDLDRGRALPVIVTDAQQKPVVDAIVFVVANGNIRSRTFTDGEGRTNVAAPADEHATLFVVPRDGSFGARRIAKSDAGPLRIDLPPPTSSLRIRTRTTSGADMPPFSLLMRFNGALVPPEIADALASTQGLHLAKGDGTDVHLAKIPSGSYEFWPYRTSDEAEAIVSTADVIAAPIHVNVRTGDNDIAVQFAAR